MTDSIKSWIEERRDFHRNRWVERESWSEAVRDWHQNFPRALDALNAVLELHKPLGYIGRDGETVWDECEHCYGSGWPCETVQAIEGAIND